MDISQQTNHGMRSDANELFCRRCITKSTNKQVVRLTACNYERCVFVTIFPDEKYGSVDYKRYHLIKLMKKERLERFNRFKDQNTRRDFLYRYTAVNSWVGASLNNIPRPTRGWRQSGRCEMTSAGLGCAAPSSSTRTRLAAGSRETRCAGRTWWNSRHSRRSSHAAAPRNAGAPGCKVQTRRKNLIR